MVVRTSPNLVQKSHQFHLLFLAPTEAAGLVPGEYVVAVGKRDVLGAGDDEIEHMLRKIKGFFSISTVPEDTIDDYATLKTSEELFQAAAR